MTYDQTRSSEQLSYLDDAIVKFISRYNSNFQQTNRKTIILFPGGLGSHLLRASTPEPDGPPFFYNTVWLDGSIAFGAAMHMRMQGDIDYLQQIIVPDGPLDLLVLRPYEDFIQWCNNHGIDYFIFGWDWRRDPKLTVDFFLDVFMPRFEQRVSTCNPNPLLHLSLVGHSFGGMIVKLILNRNDNPYVQLVKRGVTVASPFYGYGGQLGRYFIGDPDLYAFYSKRNLVRVASSLAAGYTLMFLDEDTFQRDGLALANDAEFPLANYPVLDAADGTIADPYNPNTRNGSVRYPQNYGFDPGKLARGKLICQQVAAPLVPAINSKFFNIRGVKADNNGVVNETVNNQTWDWIAPDFDPKSGNSPITDFLGPGDGTLPAWSTRLISAPAANVRTLRGGDIDHMSMMGNPQVTNALATVI
jgi:pimeloyl-ACP methyl ester carboxylesterase